MEPSPLRIALVTGGAIRVGAAIVRHLAASGYRVWVHACRSKDAARSLVDELGSAGLGPLLADLSDPAQRRDLCAQVLDPAGPAQGQLSLLVNNAASFESGPWISRSDEDLRRVLELNLVAPLDLARQLAPALASAQDGSMVHLVDLGAHIPSSDYFEHSISKAALAHASRCLALDLAPKVRSNCIAPGTVLLPPGPDYAPGSDKTRQLLAATPQARLGTPEDVAQAVQFLAQSQHMTGQCLTIDGGRSLGQGLL